MRCLPRSVAGSPNGCVRQCAGQGCAYPPARKTALTTAPDLAACAATTGALPPLSALSGSADRTLDERIKRFPEVYGLPWYAVAGDSGHSQVRKAFWYTRLPAASTTV